MSSVDRTKAFVHHRMRDTESAFLNWVSVLPSHRLRVEVLRRLGAQVSPSATLYRRLEVRSPANLHIGERTIIGDRVILDARGGLTLGGDVNLSTEVHIWTAQHDWRSPDFDTQTSPVSIEDHVWLGPRVTILPGAYLPRGVRVAAGAVVHGHLEPNTLYGGIPARPIAKVEYDFEYTLPTHQAKLWWR